MPDPSHSRLPAAYESWRRRHDQGWGLAWYLAAELCERFYASHGIIPITIAHEGLGYYGIVLAETKCRVHGPRARQLGRLTMFGDVENWVCGSPGDHGLELYDRAQGGEPVSPMVAEAIAHLRLPPFPERSHATCRHKRWGDSYRLVFRIATLLALGSDDTTVWNNPWETGPGGPPGAFLFGRGNRTVAVAGDGGVLRPDGQESLWEAYMRGASETDLVLRVEDWLGPHLVAAG